MRPLIVLWSALGLGAFGHGADPPYRPVSHFLRLPTGFQLGPVAGAAVDSHGRLIVGHRGPRPILVFGPDGQLVDSFGDAYLTAIHGTRVDLDDNIWVTDMKNHTVIKFSTAAGPSLSSVNGINPDDNRHFNRPTDVAVAPSGEFFVTDGYGNNRVVKINRAGRFVKAWGTRGKGAGQLHLPHGIVLDAKGLLHVADRENDRIQVFDQDGNYVRQYRGFAPFGIALAADQTLYVADGRANKALRMTLEGKILAEWEAHGTAPGQFDMPHGIAVQPGGAVYVTEITGKRIQKFLPRG